MEDSNLKNIILAIVLCLIVIFGWSYFAQYMGWIQPPDPQLIAQQEELQKQQAQEEIKKQQEADQAALVPTFTPSPGQDIIVETPLYKAVLYSGGATLKSFELKKYRMSLESSAPLVNIVGERTAAVAPLGLLVNSQPSWSTGKWAVEAGDNQGLKLAQGEQGSLIFNGEVDNLRVQRRLTFRADNYEIHEDVVVVNPTEQPRNVRLTYTVAADSRNASGDRYDVMRVAWDNNGNLDEESSIETLQTKGRLEAGRIIWAGAMSTYFLAGVLPQDPDNSTLKARAHNTVFRAALEPAAFLVNAKSSKSLQVRYWLGPKDRQQLTAVSEELAKSVDLGMFSLIAKGLLWILRYFYDFVHNWGIAIIMLTFVIKALFWPLTAKSYASMEKMKELQPRMLAIREKYKDDKEQMNREVMNLYRTFGVNPASGCMPILIQLPVFFGLYQALLTFIELRHAAFVEYLPGTDMLWLADLSSKDPFYITPILMGVTMVIQQKMSPPAADPTQRKIMMFLPIVFTFLFLTFPSGLVIYWLVNNILSIFQQWLMMRKNKTKKHAPRKAA
ncbi:MAG: membrane protein insertase YidC [Desulfovibrionaceae bacterium]|nr:membrane protein insertase YidC [Desulfovibrionaceae bacterium]